MNTGYYISSDCQNEDGSHICEIDSNQTIPENFRESYEVLYLPVVYFCICLLAIVVIEYFERRKYTDMTRPCVSFQIIHLLLFTMVCIVEYNNSYELCRYPIHCHEGPNDSIIQTNYYYRQKHCLRIPVRIVDSYEEISNDFDKECGDSEYGCCEIPTEQIECSELSGENMRYSHYYNYKMFYKGKWIVHESKVDNEGSNCPSIEDIIYELSEYDKNKMFNYFLGFVIETIIIVILTLCCIQKNKYKPVNTGSDNSMKASA